MDQFANYHQAVNFLEGLSNLPREKYYMTSRAQAYIYLKRTQYLLDLLGNPEKDIKYIHVTGTAGKGTVASLIHAALAASGKKAGLFTSPFATTSIEKIQVNDRYISPGEFVQIVEELKPALDKAALASPYEPVSYFEMFTAMTLLYFKKQQCEWAVLEVGCGGRFDATNVIKSPKAAILTNVDYDHVQILGKTLKKIVHEKSGIIKKHCDFYTAEQRPHLLKILRETCQKKHAKFHWIKKTGHDYSKLNRELATAVCKKIGLKADDIQKGFAKAFMPCRFEITQKNPTVVLDGAHNEVKIRSTMANLKNINYRKLILVFGVAENKDITDVLKLITVPADHIIFTRFEITERKCANPASLYKQAQGFLKEGAKIEMFLDPWHALNRALKHADKDDLILVTGSFFLSGLLREKWFPEEWVLAHRKSR